MPYIVQSGSQSVKKKSTKCSNEGRRGVRGVLNNVKKTADLIKSNIPNSAVTKQFKYVVQLREGTFQAAAKLLPSFRKPNALFHLNIKNFDQSVQSQIN